MIPSICFWRSYRRLLGAFAFGLVAPGLAVPSAYAQQNPSQGGDSVASRVGRLEQQFLDLQVSVGTLESLLRAKPGAVLPQETAAPASGGEASSAAVGDLTSRVGALETQIGALTSQLEQISKQMSALEAKLAATASAAPLPVAPKAEVPRPPEPVQQSEAAPPPVAPALAATDDDPSKPHWFGSPMGAAGDSKPQPLAPPGGAPPADQSPQGATAGIPNNDAQSLYEQGYGSMLQHDYGAAEAAFGQLIASYPSDPLAGSAQYWIGESYYVRGQYKSAADAFLKGYKKYKASDKAPDTLLKLGMSLAELGQKDAACSTFSELAGKYPQAPEHILDQAKGERKKAGC
ncbi:MAG TPA: tol-pal system protein YbgF [Methyloceanibacter sp.]|nr:tol-pal system protein YbgF [Methyloceanibacter sp.]